MQQIKINFDEKMIQDELRNIQISIDDIGNILFPQNKQLGEDLKMLAFRLGMIRTPLEAVNPTNHKQSASCCNKTRALCNDQKWNWKYCPVCGSKL